LPVVTFILVLPSGSAADFEGYEGLAAITADMMDEGTGNMSAIDVNAAFARIGAHSGDRSVCRRDGVYRDVARQIRTAGADALRRLHHPAQTRVEDFDRIRQLRLTRLVQIRDMPSAIADRAFMQVVYGTHPYAHMALGTEESLRQLTIETVKMFHSRLYRAPNATLIASGDIAAEEFRRIAADTFGSWLEGAPEIPDDAAIAPPPSAPVHRLVIVDKPGSAQSEIRIGEVGLSRDTPDYHQLIVLNMILGGSSSAAST
jgi:predicted Zn-dependent peptidase